MDLASIPLRGEAGPKIEAVIFLPQEEISLPVLPPRISGQFAHAEPEDRPSGCLVISWSGESVGVGRPFRSHDMVSLFAAAPRISGPLLQRLPGHSAGFRPAAARVGGVSWADCGLSPVCGYEKCAHRLCRRFAEPEVKCLRGVIVNGNNDRTARVRGPDDCGGWTQAGQGNGQPALISDQRQQASFSSLALTASAPMKPAAGARA